jgi:hypothetical protein
MRLRGQDLRMRGTDAFAAQELDIPRQMCFSKAWFLQWTFRHTWQRKGEPL